MTRPDHSMGERRNEQYHRAANDERGLREAKLRDHGDKQWCEYHAAETRAIEGVTDRLRPFLVEPRRDHRVDRRATGQRPAAAGKYRSREQMRR